MSDLDTTSKRRSGLQVGQPYIIAAPEPTLLLGDINNADRQHIALTYSGILVATIVGTSALVLPFPVMSATGSQKQIGTSALVLPFPVLSTVGLQVIDNVDAPLVLPFPVLSATGKEVYTATPALVLPFPVILATGEQKQIATSALVLPFPILSSTGMLISEGEAVFILPFPVLYAADQHTPLPFVLLEATIPVPDFTTILSIPEFSNTLAITKQTTVIRKIVRTI